MSDMKLLAEEALARFQLEATKKLSDINVIEEYINYLLEENKKLVQQKTNAGVCTVEYDMGWQDCLKHVVCSLRNSLS